MFYRHYDTLAQYIEQVADEYNLFIKIHDFDGFISNDKRITQTVFGNYPRYCSYVRSAEPALRHCLEKEVEVTQRCEEGKPFYGTCYAGVKMYVVPMFYEGKALGFVSAGRLRTSYEQSQSRINRTAEKFGLDPVNMNKLYFDSIENKDDIKPYEPHINLIASTLELLRIEFSKTAILQTPVDNKNVLCRKIIDYINMAYMGKLTVDVFASYYNCSRSLISHSFKSQTGMTIRQYINKVRLEKAADMLRTSEYSISSVARGVGFEDTNYFIKLFKDTYSITPGEYRKKHMPAIETTD